MRTTVPYCHCPALRFSQIVEYQAHLIGGEEFLLLPVAGPFEHVGQFGVMVDPRHQTVHGSLLREGRRIGHGYLRLAHRTDAHGLVSSFCFITFFVRFDGAKIVISYDLSIYFEGLSHRITYNDT